MSSSDVRQAIQTAVEAAAAPLPVFDMSDYVTIEDALPDIDSQAVLIQYVAVSESVSSIGGDGNQGWQQDGTVVLHLVVPSGGDSAPTVTLGDQIREALRGRRLDAKITIESCEPFMDFGGGASGLYGARLHGWASNLFYTRRDCG